MPERPGDGAGLRAGYRRRWRRGAGVERGEGDGADPEGAREEAGAPYGGGSEALAGEVEGEANDGIRSTHRVLLLAGGR